MRLTALLGVNCTHIFWFDELVLEVSRFKKWRFYSFIENANTYELTNWLQPHFLSRNVFPSSVLSFGSPLASWSATAATLKLRFSTAKLLLLSGNAAAALLTYIQCAFFHFSRYIFINGSIFSAVLEHISLLPTSLCISLYEMIYSARQIEKKNDDKKLNSVISESFQPISDPNGSFAHSSRDDW